MSELGTTITYEKVRSDAETLRNCASKMRTIFDDFGSSMNRVGAEDVYAGDASETLGQRFNKLKTKFDSYVNLVNEFSDMITTASASTEAVEKQLATEAEGLSE